MRLNCLCFLIGTIPNDIGSNDSEVLGAGIVIGGAGQVSESWKKYNDQPVPAVPGKGP